MLHTPKVLSAVAALALLGSLAPAARSQETYPMVPVDYHGDSGSFANEGDERGVIISFTVSFPGVSSLRLHFEDILLSGSTLLGDASLLRITSLEDGAFQTMNAVHVQQWENSSAYFNGSSVQVEVIASPGTGQNRVVLNGLEVGIPAGLPETICGPQDNREPSADPRSARLLPVGCTAWLINDCAKCFLSAGHCGASSGSVIQFNVPFSTSSGSLVFPGPEDQYAFDNASRQFLNSTDDWQYFGVFPNSTTGLTAYDVSGTAFDLGTPPADPTGNTIRITGFGTDNTPNSTFNQIQQTSVGPFLTVGSNLTYQTDTTGGSSGSPVIWEETGEAVGIHTNGGCTSSGGSNNGTPITATSLQNALSNPKGICKAGDNFTDLGQFLNIAPFLRPPGLTMCGDLEPGSDLSLDLSLKVPATAMGYGMTSFIIVGFSAANVPFQGGVLVPTPDIISGAIALSTSSPNTGFGVTTVWPGGIGSGTEFWIQTWIAFNDGGSVSGVLASNALNFSTP